LAQAKRKIKVVIQGFPSIGDDGFPDDNDSPFSLPGFLCHDVKVVGAGIELEVEETLNYAFCPACGVRSSSVHSHYQRRIGDVPLDGKALRLRL
jgi:hypothetical protein